MIGLGSDKKGIDRATQAIDTEMSNSHFSAIYWEKFLLAGQPLLDVLNKGIE